MLVVAIVGERNSGKTKLIEEICKRMNGKIGVIKHIHHPGVSFDIEGTDTWRAKMAGAHVVIGLAPDKTLIHMDGNLGLDEAIELMKSLGMELLLLEGFRGMLKKKAFTILTIKSPEELRGERPNAVYFEGFEKDILYGVPVLRSPEEVIQKIASLMG